MLPMKTNRISRQFYFLSIIGLLFSSLITSSSFAEVTCLVQKYQSPQFDMNDQSTIIFNRSLKSGQVIQVKSENQVVILDSNDLAELTDPSSSFFNVTLVLELVMISDLKKQNTAMGRNVSLTLNYDQKLAVTCIKESHNEQTTIEDQ